MLKFVVFLTFVIALKMSVFAQTGIAINDSSALILRLHEVSLCKWRIDSMYMSDRIVHVRKQILLRFQTDSLMLVSRAEGSLAVSQDSVRKRVDSLEFVKRKYLRELDEREREILSAARTKIQGWEDTIRQKVAERVALKELTDKILLNNNGLEIAELNELVDDDFFPNELNNTFPDVAFPADLLSEEQLSRIGELSLIKDKATPFISGAHDVQAEFANVLTHPEIILEDQVGKLEKVKALTNELANVDIVDQNEYLKKLSSLKNGEALKTEIKGQAVKQAIDHFAGKEQVLQAALGEMEKYKAKYGSLQRLSDSHDVFRNEMRGKPFAQRAVPSLVFQFQKRHNLLFDVNPAFAYRVTGRFTPGIGINYRLVYAMKPTHFKAAEFQYGPRLFVELRCWAGFSGRGEVQWMRSLNHDVHGGDPVVNTWTFTPLMGIKREFRFFRSVKGTMYLMFNLYNPLLGTSHGDLVSSRFSFEFPSSGKTVHRVRGNEL